MSLSAVAKPKLAISTPLYKQVRDLLADRISAGEWGLGQLLPNEGMLAEEFGVSIGTVRRAVESLEDVGVVARKQGRGTFVTAIDLATALEESFYRIRSPSGSPIQWARRHLFAKHRPSRAMESTCFNWIDDHLCEIASLLLAGTRPIGVERSLIPACFCSEADIKVALEQGIYAALRSRGLQIAFSEETVSIVRASEQDADVLGMDIGAPVLQVRRLAHIGAAEPVELRIACYRPDDVVYSTKLG